MKKTLLFFIIVSFLFVGFKNLPSEKQDPPSTLSGGAPAASTGAPDEKHCSSPGCHSEFAPNSGIAELSASVAGAGR